LIQVRIDLMKNSISLQDTIKFTMGWQSQAQGV
jgi:hypothetical protein